MCADPLPKERYMAHPVIHAEIRSEDPDATRRFFADLFGWQVASEGGLPGYTFIDTGGGDGPAAAHRPRPGAPGQGGVLVCGGDGAPPPQRGEGDGGIRN